MFLLNVEPARRGVCPTQHPDTVVDMNSITCHVITEAWQPFGVFQCCGPAHSSLDIARLNVNAELTKVAEAKDAAAISDDNDLDVVGGPVVADVPEVAAVVEAVKVHAQRLPAIASAFRFTM